MSKLRIYIDGSPVLREKSSSIKVIDEETLGLVRDMVETLRDLPGYGLAAPQVGHSKRIVIIESKPSVDENGQEIAPALPLLVLINPVITKYSSEKCDFEEGCFSVPLYRGNVIRPKKIKVTAQNERGEIININASGLLSRVIQHEIDHLDGILFTDLIEDKSKLIKNEISAEWKDAIEG